MKTLHFGSTYYKRSIIVKPVHDGSYPYAYAIWSKDFGKWCFTKDIESVYDLDRCFTVDSVQAVNKFDYDLFSDGDYCDFDHINYHLSY